MNTSGWKPSTLFLPALMPRTQTEQSFLVGNLLFSNVAPGSGTSFGMESGLPITLEIHRSIQPRPSLSSSRGGLRVPRPLTLGKSCRRRHCRRPSRPRSPKSTLAATLFEDVPPDATRSGPPRHTAQCSTKQVTCLASESIITYVNSVQVSTRTKSHAKPGPAG